MERILITGARGFLGSRLVSRLAQEKNNMLFAVTSSKEAVRMPAGVSVEPANLLDTKSVKHLIKRVCPDVCIHLAWGQRESDYRNALSNYQWLAASISLFSEFQENGGKQFFFAGSSGEYEGCMRRMQEVSQPNPMSLYGQCKKTASELFLNAGTEMQVQIARCFTVYGPGDTHRFGAIPTAICSLLKGKAFYCQNPRAIRDYIFIDDAVEAVFRLLRSGHCGAIDIGSGIPRSMRDVFSEIARQLDCTHRVFFRGEAGAETILTADNTFLRETLHMPPQTLFTEGIRQSIAYWRTQLGVDKYGV